MSTKIPNRNKSNEKLCLEFNARIYEEWKQKTSTNFNREDSIKFLKYKKKFKNLKE